MSGVAEVRHHAKMFNWGCFSDDYRRQDTFVLGPNMVTVDYRKNGCIEAASRYEFYRIDEPRLVETASDRNRKSEVLAWLASLGN